MEVPLGSEWNTRVGFQQGTLPRVVKKVRASILSIWGLGLVGEGRKGRGGGGREGVGFGGGFAVYHCFGFATGSEFRWSLALTDYFL